MAAKKQTIQQKQTQRDAEKAKAKAVSKATPSRDRIDEIVAQCAVEMGGDGFVMRGSQVREQIGKRAPTGNPAIDYVLCGGPPEGTLIEFGGPYSSGKTTLSLHLLRNAQQIEWAKPAHERRAQAWVALEPFSKTWARENGFWIPFCEDEVLDEDTGELRPMDPFSAATQAELLRMEELGIVDPYAEITAFVLIVSQIGDKALDVALTLLESNRFSHIVVDSLATARSTKWINEKDTQAAGDFSREARMISEYTTRALLTLNRRYDDNGEWAKDGKNRNRTILIHLNQIVTNIGVQAFAAHKVFGIKGGEGNKHNHHAIVFVNRVKLLEGDIAGGGKRTYGQVTRLICIKSKIGVPFREAEFEVYFENYGNRKKGEINVSKCAVELGVMLGVVTQGNGSWLSINDLTANGRDAMAKALDLPENEHHQSHLLSELRKASLGR